MTNIVKAVCCVECNIVPKWVLYGNARHCPDCGTEDDTFEYIYAPNKYPIGKGDISSYNMVTWQEFHDVSKYNIEIFSRLQESVISGKHILQICKELPNPFHWCDVFRAFQRLGLESQWTSFGWNSYMFENFRWSSTEWNTVVELHILLPYLKEKYKWKCVKKISYYYMLKKLQDMQGKNTEWIPIKATQVKLTEYELKWKDICVEMDWDFGALPEFTITKVTKTGKERRMVKKNMIPPIKWDKLGTIAKIKENMTRSIMEEKQRTANNEYHKHKNDFRLYNQ